jgi:serine/threonine protein phosphatase PrpC
MLEHPQKSHLLNCLGGPATPTVSVGVETPLQHGDTLLLCTDGLWEAFSPEEMMPYFRPPALDAGVEEMLFAAVRKKQRSSDNVSAVGLRWEDTSTKSPPLQGGDTPSQINEDMLREEAKHHLPHVAKLPPKPSPSPASETTDDSGRPLESRIQEIEDFLKKFEK